MISNLILHSDTDAALRSILQSPPHALLLSGNSGSGKEYTAKWLASNLLGAELTNHPYFMHIKPEAGKTIGVDNVRELKQFVRLKTTGSKTIRRIVLIADAQSMTVEAQNALLKLLEEPPEDTIILMTVQNQKSLMPTIYSRVQQVHIKPITKQQAANLSQGTSAVDIERAYLLSRGDVGLLISLLENNDSHELVEAIRRSKELLAGNMFSRLQLVDSLSKDKDDLANLLFAMKRICAAAIIQSVDKGNDVLFKRWQTSLEAIYNSEKSLKGNANVKLLLTDLFLSI